MIKRNNHFRHHTMPSGRAWQVRVPVGCFAGEAWAVCSRCGTYRYRTVRVWDSDKPRFGVVGHCGSVTTGWLTDPTMRRCIGYPFRR
jgi:hypothetical protein